MKLIVWSGGLDSTALILKCLEENTPFETLYIKTKNLNEHKVECELEARQRIKHILCEKHKFIWKDRVVNIGTFDTVESRVYPISQPYLWCYGAIRGIDRNTSEIWFGYIRYDSFWHCRPRFEKAYYSNLDLIRGDEDVVNVDHVKYIKR
jgi:hypothetical protein